MRSAFILFLAGPGRPGGGGKGDKAARFAPNLRSASRPTIRWFHEPTCRPKSAINSRLMAPTN